MVVVIAVARRREGFAQTSSGVVRVRRGSRDDPLFGAELVRFANERTSSRYETTVTDVRLDAVDSDLRAELGRACGWPRATTDRLREMQLADGSHLTVAGALYLLRDPQRALGKVHLELQRFPDDATIDYDQRRELRGPLPHVLTEAVSAIVSELGTELVVLGSRRYDLARRRWSCERLSPTRSPTAATRRRAQRYASRCARHRCSFAHQEAYRSR